MPEPSEIDRLTADLAEAQTIINQARQAYREQSGRLAEVVAECSDARRLLSASEDAHAEVRAALLTTGVPDTPFIDDLAAAVAERLKEAEAEIRRLRDIISPGDAAAYEEGMAAKEAEIERLRAFERVVDKMNCTPETLHERFAALQERAERAEDLSRFLAGAYSRLSECWFEALALDGDALKEYTRLRIPVLQGTREQQAIRQIGEQPHDSQRVTEAVRALITPNPAAEGRTP